MSIEFVKLENFVCKHCRKESSLPYHSNICPYCDKTGLIKNSHFIPQGCEFCYAHRVYESGGVFECIDCRKRWRWVLEELEGAEE